ncbi:heterodisulfide reductase-related iron-sulfur binding cluster, partial [Salmonella enterica subsp. enterica serovar Kentucky]|nr:heterodisulfide reductase-related iron-sulfur binding cluster [Salmonella enterica subsp. enterica serovar Kentucky]
GKRAVAVTEQNIEWNKKGALVQITRGGICGSDLHYYQEGKVGKKENYPTSQSIGAPLFRQIEESGADIVVTDCETCKWQIEMST